MKSGVNEMFFSKKKIDERTAHHEYAVSSNYGRAITSIKSAKNELYHEPINFNPLELVSNDKYFLGLDHFTNELLYNSEPIHTQIVAPTRAGKGVFIGLKVVEALKEQKGLIIVDPKEDDFLVQVILEELERQNRADDLQIVNWPNDFGYTVFSDLDTVEEATKKLVVMLDLIEKENEAGTSFYRKSERILLSKIMYIFFNASGLLNITIDRTLSDLSIFIKYIMRDIYTAYEFEEEKEKSKPNFDKLDRLSKRYFNPKLFSQLGLRYSQLSTLESLQFSISEFENVSIYNNFEISDALTSAKVLYIKSDMLDETALKFLKLVIVDIIQQSKKLKNDTNCLVVLDELSFYPTQILSAGLATAAGFGIKFILSYQSEAQMKDEKLRTAIKDNCQTKIYYKSSDDRTLKYVELLSGLELVSQITKKGNEATIKQMQEPHMNITRLRALPRSRVAILIEENLNEVKIFQTAPVPVRHKFDWTEINENKVHVEKLEIKKEFEVAKLDEDLSSDNKKELVL